MLKDMQLRRAEQECKPGMADPTACSRASAVTSFLALPIPGGPQSSKKVVNQESQRDPPELTGEGWDSLLASLQRTRHAGSRSWPLSLFLDPLALSPAQSQFPGPLNGPSAFCHSSQVAKLLV